jgi:sulfur-oxidizing protein SoxY
VFRAPTLPFVNTQHPGITMHHFSATTTRTLAVAALMSVMAVPASAGTIWDEIKGSVYGDRKIEDGRGVVTLDAEIRPADMRNVPFTVDAALKDGRTVKSVSLIIDENPTPVVAVFNMGDNRDSVAFKSNFRVNQQSDIRAVVEASDGQLYMVSRLVKFAGGQASCSAPPMGDPAEIAANMGKMKFTQLPNAGTSSSALQHARVDFSHPNHTGMVMDQQTLLYTPMMMVSEITVKQGGELIFRAEGSIAFSQNPMIEFDMKRNGASEVEVTLKDTDGGSWTQKFPVNSES